MKNKKQKGFFPTEIIFSTTNACNLNCPHCFVKKSSEKLDIQKAKDLIEECCKFQDSSNFPFINKIGFTGGEPFLYKDFLFEVTKFAIEKDFLFDQIMTNGCWWKSEEELNETLQQLFEIGYDGKIGLSWDIFHNQDEEKIKIFIEQVHAVFGSDSLVIQTVKPFVQNPKKMTDEEMSLLEKSQKLEKTIKSLFPEVPLYVLPQSFESENPKCWQSKKWFKEDFCQGPGNILFVHSDGNISPCCGFANENPQLFIGKITDSIETILQNAKSNKMIQLCFEKGLSSVKKIAKKAHKGKCGDICSFCDFICKNGKV